MDIRITGENKRPVMADEMDLDGKAPDVARD
jgi:hypothetical protein